MTILTVQLIVEFSKRVPGFDTLLREDQITLLKACSSEVMMLRCSRKYDMKTDSIVYANNQPYTRENYKSASVGDSADALFNFCKTMCVLKVDNAEYALLTAIVIFSGMDVLSFGFRICRDTKPFFILMSEFSCFFSYRTTSTNRTKKSGKNSRFLY
jgi:ecdysone receptor